MSRFLKKLYLAIAVPCALNLPLFLGMLEQLMERQAQVWELSGCCRFLQPCSWY